MMSLIMTFITIRRAAIKGHYGLEEFTDVSGRQGSTVSKLKTFWFIMLDLLYMEKSFCKVRDINKKKY